MEQPRHQTLIAIPEELRSARIVLRPYRPDDADALYAAIDESRETLAPWLPWVGRYTGVDDARDFCRRVRANWILRADLTLGIFAGDGTYLGGTGLHQPNWEARTFEIGYWLRRSAEGHGYMGEAVRLLTTMAFTDLGANRVVIRCDARNDRSCRIAERVGYVFEGRLRHDSLAPDGTIRDTLVFALIPTDFASLRERWASAEAATP